MTRLSRTQANWERADRVRNVDAFDLLGVRRATYGHLERETAGQSPGVLSRGQRRIITFPVGHPGSHTPRKTDIVESSIELWLGYSKQEVVFPASSRQDSLSGTMIYDRGGFVGVEFKKRELKEFLDRNTAEFKEAQSRAMDVFAADTPSRIDTQGTEDAEEAEARLFSNMLKRKMKTKRVKVKRKRLGKMKLSPLRDEEDA